MTIQFKGDTEIKITFKEFIPHLEGSEPLGLGYPLDDQMDDKQEEPDLYDGDDGDDNDNVIKDQQIKAKVYDFNIKDEDICVSSFHEDNPPSHARLNHPTGCWMPTEQNERSRNVFICIDLGTRKAIEKLQIQGSQDNKARVKEIWIEYSDDLCSWKTHSTKCIELEYVKGQLSKSKSRSQLKPEAGSNNIPLQSENGLNLDSPSGLAMEKTVIEDYDGRTNLTAWYE